MKFMKIFASLMAVLLLYGCADTSAKTSTTTSTTEAPAPIEYHDKYVDLKSGERLYYRYQYLSTALWRTYITDLDKAVSRYQLFAKVKLEAVRLDAFLEPYTLAGYNNGAMAYDIQIQEVYRQDDTWTDTMTDEVNNGLVYSNIGGYLDGNNEEGLPRLQINIIGSLGTTMLLEDTEYYVCLDQTEDYYIVIPVGEVNHPFPNDSPLITAWGKQVEVSVSADKSPELWDTNNEKLTTPNRYQFQAYIRYTLKDEEYYQQIKNEDSLTYEYALELLNNRPAQ